MAKKYDPITIPKTAKTDDYHYGVAPLASYKTSTGADRGIGWLVFTSKTLEAAVTKSRRLSVPAVVLYFVNGIGNGPQPRTATLMATRQGTVAYDKYGAVVEMPAKLLARAAKVEVPAEVVAPVEVPTTSRKTAKTAPVEVPAEVVEVPDAAPVEVVAGITADDYRASFAAGLITRKEMATLLRALDAATVA